MARVGFSALVASIENLIDGELEDYRELIISHMTQAYEMTLDLSPVISAYYKSNHSIAVRSGGSLKTGDATLEPETKESEERGVYEANISPRASTELQKLQSYEIGDTIRIVTIVPYADQVEAIHGVYTSVAQTFDLSDR